MCVCVCVRVYVHALPYWCLGDGTRSGGKGNGVFRRGAVPWGVLAMSTKAETRTYTKVNQVTDNLGFQPLLGVAK